MTHYIEVNLSRVAVHVIVTLISGLLDYDAKISLDIFTLIAIAEFLFIT